MEPELRFMSYEQMLALRDYYDTHCACKEDDCPDHGDDWDREAC